MKELLTIFWTFFKMGAVTFGGGYAMLPILKREVVQSHKWVDDETIMDYYALSQGLPGIIAVNVAVFIGYRHKKEVGSFAAALGVVTPSIIIISIIAMFLSNFKDNVYVRHALAGISVCVAALILDAVLSLWKKGVKDIFGIIVCAAIFALSAFTDVSPILLVIACAILGIAKKTLDAKKSAGGSSSGNSAADSSSTGISTSGSSASSNAASGSSSGNSAADSSSSRKEAGK